MTRLLPLLLLPILASCAHRADFGSYGRIEDPGVVLRVIRERWERVQGLAAEGKLALDSPRGSGTLRMAAEVRKPASVYLETRDILGIARGTFATNGETYAFYRPDENEFYSGPATAEELGRYLPVALPPERLVSVMLGEVPLLDTEDRRMSILEGEGVYEIVLRQGRVVQRVRAGTKDLRLVSIETRGVQDVDVACSDHELLEADLPFPTTVELTVPSQRTKVKLRYTKTTLNPPSEPADFVLQPPPGAKVMESG